MIRSKVAGLRRGVGALALALVLTDARPLFAQTDDERAGARAAAEAGANAFMERRWADAIDLFARAESLVHSPVHYLYMARAYERLGRLVKARESYIKVANEPVPPGAPEVLREARDDAEKELRQLEPRIPYVSVVVQGAGASSVTVTMDGVQVPPALIGVPRPVDPGEHKFQAFADGMESAISGTTLNEGRQETVVLTLVALAPGATPTMLPAAPGSQQEPPPSMPPPQDAAEDQGSGKSGLKVAGFVSLGVGVAGLAAGTVFGLQAKSKREQADDLCRGPSRECLTADQPRIDRLDDEATSANTMSIVGFVVGGVGVATGITLLILAGKSSSTAEDRSAVRPWIGLGSAGVSGRF
jgi:hypothetical protein